MLDTPISDDEVMQTSSEPIMEVEEHFRTSVPLVITRDNVAAYFVGLKLGI